MKYLLLLLPLFILGCKDNIVSSRIPAKEQKTFTMSIRTALSGNHYAFTIDTSGTFVDIDAKDVISSLDSTYFKVNYSGSCKIRVLSFLIDKPHDGTIRNNTVVFNYIQEIKL